MTDHISETGVQAGIAAVYLWADGDARQIAEAVIKAYLATLVAPAPAELSVGWRPVSCLKLRMAAGKLRKADPTDETASLMEEAAADIERLAHASAALSVGCEKTLRMIAAQALTSEIGTSFVLNDIEGTHDAMILEARSALTTTADTQNPLSSTNGEIGETRQATAELSAGSTDRLFFTNSIKPVPHEPTPEMLAAAVRADQDGMPATMKTIWMVMWGAYASGAALSASEVEG